jgi:hypothetical protein
MKSHGRCQVSPKTPLEVIQRMKAQPSTRVTEPFLLFLPPKQQTEIIKKKPTYSENTTKQANMSKTNCSAFNVIN